MLRLTLLFALLNLGLYAQQPGQLSGEERSEISNHLENSWDKLENLLTSLSVEQWHYKPVDSIWSIAEISEHLEKSEKQLFDLVTNQLTQANRRPKKAEKEKAQTKAVMAAITSRDHKIKTSPELEPDKGYRTPKDFLKHFDKLRKASIEYAGQTEDQLRLHFISFGPLGDLDGYQILMIMSGHMERHIQQIEEVMGDPNYPSA